MNWVKNNSLTLVLMAVFAVTLTGQALSGWSADNNERAEHGRAAMAFIPYLTSGDFLSALFENWESEFLQMAAYVFLTAYLVQRGSAESKDPDGADNEAEADEKTPEARKPALARRSAGALARRLYAHSLRLALALLFVISFVLHWLNSARAQAEEAALHGEAAVGLVGRLADPDFWFESFQNWQSEFLSTAVLVVLSIWLRQKHSPESKPVAAPHDSTGR